MKAKDLINFCKQLQKLENNGCPIRYRYEMTNMGIVDKPQSIRNNMEIFLEKIDLGGREISIHISIPNKTNPF